MTTGCTPQLLLEDKPRVPDALNGAQDNPEMESFYSRFKSENLSMFADAQGPSPLGVLVRDRVSYYNRSSRYSSSGT